MIDVYLEMYKRSHSVFNLQPMEDDNYKTFLLKTTGYPITMFYVKENLDLVAKLTDDYQIKIFKNNDHVWMIPIEITDFSIHNFVLRGHENRAYFSPPTESKLPILFGFYDFLDFQKGQPICLTEGIKDALIIKQVYKYVIALTTAGLSKVTLSILEKFSDKFVLMYDDDATGNKASQNDITKLKSLSKSVEVLKPRTEDYGDYIKHPHYVKLLQEELPRKIESFDKYLGGCHEVFK